MLLEWPAKNLTSSILIASPFLDPDLSTPSALLMQWTLFNWWSGTCRVFCAPCIAQDWVGCINKGYVQSWPLKKLLPKNPRMIRAADDWVPAWGGWSQFGGEFEVITNHLQIGTNFVVRVEDENEEGVHYYLLAMLRPRFRVDVPFICAWGNEFRVGDYAIEGMYYQKFGRNTFHNYVCLIGSQPAYIHADSVKATDFPMVIQSHRVPGKMLFTSY
jgi:hypothetical protein